jgi:uncharacterized protein (DUF433 family)
MDKEQLIQRSEEILGGTPVFAGTRVPLQSLIDYLKRGHSLDEFLSDFPTVRREQAEGVLDAAKAAIVSKQ